MGNLVFQATLGGQVNLVGPNTASTYNINVPATSGDMVTTGDTGTVTNTMLAGSIANAKLVNSSFTLGSTAVSLGETKTTFAGMTLTNPTINGYTGDTSVVNIGSGQFYKDTSGNVGIGTSSPSQKLHVYGATSTYGRIESVNAGTGAGLTFKNATSNWLIGAGPASGLSEFAILDQTSGSVARLYIDTSGNLQFNSGYGSVATAYGCRAWVNFNGTGTVAIRASGNVSSITDNGTGDYTVNFTTAMPDANYSITGTAQTVGNSTTFLGVTGILSGAPTTSNWRFNVKSDGGGSADSPYVFLSVVR